MAKAPKTKDSSGSKSGGGDNFTRWLVAGMVGLVVVVAVAFSLFSNRTNTAATLPSTVKQSDGYGISFNSGIKPVIDIWEDFQCPVCKNFEAVVGEYLNQLIVEKKVNVIFHTLSFIGDESILAANAAACASEEDKFLPFHALLYQTQSAKENSGLWNAKSLQDLGAQVGATSDKFTACVKDGTYAQWVANVASDGAKKNVNSTPTVFINGVEMDRNTQYFNLEAFKAALVTAGLKG